MSFSGLADHLKSLWSKYVGTERSLRKRINDARKNGYRSILEDENTTLSEARDALMRDMARAQTSEMARQMAVGTGRGEEMFTSTSTARDTSRDNRAVGVDPDPPSPYVPLYPVQYALQNYNIESRQDIEKYLESEIARKEKRLAGKKAKKPEMFSRLEIRDGGA